MLTSEKWLKSLWAASLPTAGGLEMYMVFKVLSNPSCSMKGAQEPQYGILVSKYKIRYSILLNQ